MKNIRFFFLSEFSFFLEGEGGGGGGRKIFNMFE